MLQHTRSLKRIAHEISDAANGALQAYIESRASEEPRVTDRILGAIEDRIRDQSFNGIVWKARTLRTGRGIAAEEKRHGADLMGVLDICLPDYETKKGFLVQAKRAEPGSPFSQPNWNRLVCQCKKMIRRTPDSFVFAYSKTEKIRVFSANSVLGLRSRNIFDLYHHGIQRFFEDHIKCFIGDPRLNSTNIEVLDALADFSVKRVLHLSARTPA